MKKTSLVNLIIISGLLVLCVMTLIAVYGTAPVASVLLFEEDFNVLDEAKWEHRTAECQEDGGRFQYSRTDAGDGYAEDGVLHLKPNRTLDRHRAKREKPRKCFSCVSSQDEHSDADCVSSSYSTKLQTRTKFEATQGRIEVRAKLPGGDWIKSFIGVERARNEEPEDDSEDLVDIVNAGGEDAENGSAKLLIYLGSAPNRTIIKSSVTRDEFHVYEIEWTEEKITFKIDQELVGEQELESSAGGEGRNSTETGEPGERKWKRTVDEPFYLNVGVDVGEGPPKNHTEDKRSLRGSTDQSERGSGDGAALQVDYIRLFKTKS